MSEPEKRPAFGEAFRFWLMLGLISFGGPSGQIAIMHDELVQKRKWIGEAHFLHALNYCMLLPGPEAQQLAIYIGWLLHRVRGGLVAGIFFVLPSAILLWVFAWVYVAYGQLPEIAALFDGLKPAVLAIVALALFRVGRRALRAVLPWLIAATAFVALRFFSVPFPLVILAAGLTGWMAEKTRPGSLGLTIAETKAAKGRVMPPAGIRRTLAISLVCLLAWWLPVILSALALGADHTVFREAIFFSKAALVTFGGAYAVLPYVSQQAVEQYHWLTAAQMVDGLGLAETTPGPLIMVLQFVGFLGAWHHPGGLPPLLAATLGAFLTTWTTFAPCFLWIFAGAPYLERLRGNVALSAALSAITAAVVGGILNLAVWFGGHVLFKNGAPDWFALAVFVAAGFGMLRWKWNVVLVIVGSALAGLIHRLIFG